MEEFTRRKPTPESPAHFTWLNVDGEVIGETIVEYSSKPFPHYYLGNVDINENKRGQGYGTKMLDDFESMLLKTGRAGVLNDLLAHMNGLASPVVGMYERRGWKRFENTNLLTFNLPEGVTDADIKELDAIKHSLERQNRIDQRFYAQEKSRQEGDR